MLGLHLLVRNHGRVLSRDRILTTRDCYPPKEFPTSVTVVGCAVAASA